jgi:hypothetical protein
MELSGRVTKDLPRGVDFDIEIWTCISENIWYAAKSSSLDDKNVFFAFFEWEGL